MSDFTKWFFKILLPVLMWNSQILTEMTLTVNWYDFWRVIDIGAVDLSV